MNQPSKPDNAKAAIFHYIEKRLHEWAEWFNRKENLIKGYATTSIEYRMMTEGFIPNENFGPKPLPSNESAEEIESHIKEMSNQHQAMAEVLRVYYLQRGNLRDKARRVGISQNSI